MSPGDLELSRRGLDVGVGLQLCVTMVLVGDVLFFGIGANQAVAPDCDERGPPRVARSACHPRSEFEEAHRSCCTLDWI